MLLKLRFTDAAYLLYASKSTEGAAKSIKKDHLQKGVKKAQAKRRCSSGIRTSKAKSKRAAKSKDRNDVYCWCQEGEYGEMIACDNVACPIEWFHFECLGLTAAPAGRWLCPDCEDSNR